MYVQVYALRHFQGGTLPWYIILTFAGCSQGFDLLEDLKQVEPFKQLFAEAALAQKSMQGVRSSSFSCA